MTCRRIAQGFFLACVLCASSAVDAELRYQNINASTCFASPAEGPNAARVIRFAHWIELTTGSLAFVFCSIPEPIVAPTLTPRIPYQVEFFAWVRSENPGAALTASICLHDVTEAIDCGPPTTFFASSLGITGGVAWPKRDLALVSPHGAFMFFVVPDSSRTTIYDLRVAWQF